MHSNNTTNPASLKQVICMKWGTLYSPEYVNRLYAMVRANTTGNLRFVCLTDNSDGLRQEIETYACPTLNLSHPNANKGWRKLTLYRSSQELFELSGVWLYLDLDVVVSGSLDEFFEFDLDAKYTVMQNWTQPGKGIGNTSVFRYTIGKLEYLHDNFMKNPEQVFSEYNNSQTYISKNVESIRFWPDEWCALFKVQCLPAWPFRFFKEPLLPENARVIAFPGDPNPHDAVLGHWPVKKGWKKLYKSIRPATWISRIWEESEKKSNS